MNNTNNTNNTKNLRTAITAVALGASALLPAMGQNIYRCGDSYGHQPCSNGRVITAVGTRISDDARAARLASQRDAALAETMERARLKDESKPANAYIPRAAEKTAADSAEQPKPIMTRGLKPHTFSAVAPGEKKTKASNVKKRGKEAPKTARATKQPRKSKTAA